MAIIEIVYRETGQCPRCKGVYAGYTDAVGFHCVAHQCEPPDPPSHAYVLRSETPEPPKET